MDACSCASIGVDDAERGCVIACLNPGPPAWHSVSPAVNASNDTPDCTRALHTELTWAASRAPMRMEREQLSPPAIRLALTAST